MRIAIIGSRPECTRLLARRCTAFGFHAETCDCADSYIWPAISRERAECTFDAWRYPGANCAYERRPNECGWWWPGEYGEFRCAS